jgi:hypothetical protein
MAMPDLLLHLGGASTASVIVSLAGIFLLLLIMSFAFWRGPQERRRFSRPWLIEWLKASAPRVLVAGAFCTGLFFASYYSSGNTQANDPQVCLRGLPPLTGRAVTGERLEAGIAGLRELASAASEGDMERVRVLIFSDAHSITHDVDPQLRPLDATLARDLCASVLALESEIAASEPDATFIASEGARAASLLEQAQTILAGTTPTPDPFAKPGASACDSPIGAVSDQPITRERIEAVIPRYEALATAAASGDTASMTGIFFGDPHDITHDIDGPLRQVDLELAKELCLSVLTLEIQLAGAYELNTIQTEANRCRELLADALEALEL